MTKRTSRTPILLLVCSLAFFLSTVPRAVAAGGHEHHMHDHHAQAPEMLSTVDMETRPAELKAAGPSMILFSLKDAGGNPLRDLAISHDRILHVVIISEDFGVFSHVHPEDFGPVTSEMTETATFPIRYEFPKAGKYLIAVDYAVRASHLSEQFIVEVTDGPHMTAAAKDLSKKKKFGDYEVRLETDPGRIYAGDKVTLSFEIRKQGEKVKDLEPYLSAPMHLAIVMDDLSTFTHAHGDVPGAEPQAAGGHVHDKAPGKFGPRVDAAVVFPSKGLYRIFSQVMHQGQVLLFDFTVEAR